MIRIDLPKPMCTLAQVHQVAERLNMDEGQLDLLNRGARCIVVNDDLELMPEELNCKKGDIIKHQKESWEKECAKYGAEGLEWLCQQNRYGLYMIKSVNIPADVYYETSESQWRSICSFAAKLENRCNRLRKLQEMGAPLIILYNEYRELWECFERLESNSVGEPERWADGMIKRSLNDVGYSIVSGWIDGAPNFEDDEELEIEEEIEGEGHEL